MQMTVAQTGMWPFQTHQMEDRLSPKITDEIPSLEDVLTNYPDLPSRSAIMGVDEEGTPILFDLMDAQVNSILVAGKSGCGKTALFKSLVRSALALNSPYEVKTTILANDPAEWEDITSTHDKRYFVDVAACGSRRAGDIIMEMSTKAEQRSYGRELGPAIIVIIENLLEIFRQDYEATLSFEWLLRNGASSQVWPVAAIEDRSADQVSTWIPSFRTRVIGGMLDRSMAQHCAGTPNPPLLLSENMFAVKVGKNWKEFGVAL